MPKAPWRLIGLSIGIIAIGVGVYFSSVYEHRLREQLADVRSERDQLVLGDKAVSEELEALRVRRKSNDALVKESELLTIDRDNILAQVKRLQEERDEAVGIRSLLERMLNKTGTENRELKSRLEPAEEELGVLKAEWERLVADRDRMEREIIAYQDKDREENFKTKIEQLRTAKKQIEREATQAKQQMVRAKKAQKKVTAELERREMELKELKEKYKAEVKENSKLMTKVSRLPVDIDRLAREHERLLKDLADTHYNMGVSFTKQKDFSRGVKEFEMAIQLRPNDADAWYNLGIIYSEHLMNRPRALSSFEEYLHVKPPGHDGKYAQRYIAKWRAWEGKEQLTVDTR